jgi:hypothetical protein
MRRVDRVHAAQLAAMRVAEIKAGFAEKPAEKLPEKLPEWEWIVRIAPRAADVVAELEALRDSRNGWLIPVDEPSIDDVHSVPRVGYANLNNDGCRTAVYGGEWL